jgi:hypothetical protein
MGELDRRIANYLLIAQPGAAILNTRRLAEEHQVSIGSISASLNHLEAIGAIRLRRRGRLGTVLEDKSIVKLWKCIANGPMVIALTLPSFSKCEGLATAVYSLLNSAGIETYLIFIRGSYNRLKALKTGLCNAIVISKLSADELSTEHEYPLIQLPPRTFVTDHRVLLRRSRPKTDAPLVVGIDYDSYDIRYLTELEFAGEHVQYLPIPYTQTDFNFGKSAVDAVLSNADHLSHLDSRDFITRPLSPHVQAIMGDRDTSAVILIRRQDTASAAVLTECLQIPQMLEIQQKVVDGLMIPRY